MKRWGAMTACIVFFFLFFFSLLPRPLYAAEVTVVTEEWIPYSFVSNGHVIGISTEIVEQALHRAGVSIAGGQVRLMPWARAYYTVRRNRNTLIYTILRTPERESLFKWVGPLVPPDSFYFFKLASRTDIRLHSLADARSYRIGILKDSVHGQFLRRHGFDASNLDPASYQVQNMKKLINGRVDLIVDVGRTVRLRAERLGIPYATFARALFLFRQEYYMAFSRDTPDALVHRVGAALAAMKKDGTVERILCRYQGLAAEGKKW
ncbi:MAG TPA: transporter substrate-binding domain-containing protein [Desulfobulbus sp.]|nr:transporter substrate-binding domain-containing protein [Desulfobulbus sp.]